jgi:hypothetical protein
VGRYGDQVEYDLHHELGLDILDFFRGRLSWAKLTRLIRQFPSDSLTAEAMAEDDELAEAYADQPVSDSGPRVSEYTAAVARLDVLTDRIGDLISLVHQVATNKPLRVKPARRPETAFGRVAAKRRDQRMSSLVAEVEAAQERWSATK